MADGDRVCFQTHVEKPAPDHGTPMRVLVQHAFRFNAGGKIAEHWSMSSHVKLSETRNKHPLFEMGDPVIHANKVYCQVAVITLRHTVQDSRRPTFQINR